MTVRTFIAVETDPSIRAAVVRLQGELDARSIEARWTPPENLHLTLKFLGEVADTLLPHVCEVAHQVAGEVAPFTVTAEGLGTFGSPRRPRIIWCGFAGEAVSLVRLHDRLDELLAPLGVPGEGRRYTPHLTVGRVRARSGPGVSTEVLAPYASWSGGSQHVEQIVVFSSQLGRGGARYETLARCPLAGLGT